MSLLFHGCCHQSVVPWLTSSTFLKTDVTWATTQSFGRKADFRERLHAVTNISAILYLSHFWSWENTTCYFSLYNLWISSNISFIIISVWASPLYLSHKNNLSDVGISSTSSYTKYSFSVTAAVLSTLSPPLHPSDLRAPPTLWQASQFWCTLYI